MHSEHPPEPKVGQQHLTQSIFYNKESTTSCNLLKTVMKVSHGMTVWVQNGCQYVGGWPSSSLADWELPPYGIIREDWWSSTPCVPSLGKNPHSKFPVWNLLNADHSGTIMKHKTLSWTIVSQGLSVIKLENLIPKGPSLTNILLEKKKKAFAVEHKSRS